MSLIMRVFQNNFIPEIVRIWNCSATQCHGFYPLDADHFYRQVVACSRFKPENFLLAESYGKPLGWIHFDVVEQTPYERAGVVCALVVDPDYRCRGYGGKLLARAVEALERQGCNVIDAFGCWPYSPFYATLINGSEPGGVDKGDRASNWLFDSFQFQRERESIVMRASLEEFEGSVLDSEQVYYQSRKGKTTWLDFVFRGWELFDHALLSDSGEILSRAIHARMDGFCEQCDREIHSLFGVYTAESLRGKGYAARNLQLMLSRINQQGGRVAELHVYADNTPALTLYGKLGFREIDRSLTLRRR